MTILAKMHDKMAAQTPRYAGPQSAPLTMVPQAVHSAPAMAVPVNLFDELTSASAPIRIKSSGLTLMEVFKMYACAQDNPGTLVSVNWQVGPNAQWCLTVRFNYDANTADWSLEINDGQRKVVAFDCQSRDLTELYRTVLQSKQIA